MAQRLLKQEADYKHKLVVKALLAQIGIFAYDSSEEDDIHSRADLWIPRKSGDIALGLKSRGLMAGMDFNLTGWSEYTGLLPEFATAGDKHFFHTFEHYHVLSKMPSQATLDKIAPDPLLWRKIPNLGAGKTKMIADYACIRAGSIYSKDPTAQQGVIYVPKELVNPIIIWDKNEHIRFLNEVLIVDIL